MNCASCSSNVMRTDGTHVCSIVAQRLWEKRNLDERAAEITHCVTRKMQPAACPRRWLWAKKLYNFIVLYQFNKEDEWKYDNWQEPEPQAYWLHFIILGNLYEARIPIQRGLYKMLPASSILGRLIELLICKLKRLWKKPEDYIPEHFSIWCAGQIFHLPATMNVIDTIEINTSGGYIPWNPKVPGKEDLTLSMQISIDTKQVQMTPEVFFFPSIRVESIMDLRYLSARTAGSKPLVTDGLTDADFDPDIRGRRV